MKNTRVKPFIAEDITLFGEFLNSLSDRTLKRAVIEQWFRSEQTINSAKENLISVAEKNTNNATDFNSDLQQLLTAEGIKKLKRAFSKFKSARGSLIIKVSKKNHSAMIALNNKFGFDSMNDTLEHLLDPDDAIILFLKSQNKSL